MKPSYSGTTLVLVVCVASLQGGDIPEQGIPEVEAPRFKCCWRVLAPIRKWSPDTGFPTWKCVPRFSLRKRRCRDIYWKPRDPLCHRCTMYFIRNMAINTTATDRKRFTPLFFAWLLFGSNLPSGCPTASWYVANKPIRYFFWNDSACL